MPKRYSSKEIVSVLTKKSFRLISQKGSHVKYRQGQYTVIVVAGKKQVPVGTFSSILRQAGMTLKEFKELLN